MKDLGNWKQSRMENAIVSDIPTSEQSKSVTNVEHYGGYLVCESVFNEDIRKLIIKSPELIQKLKELLNFIDDYVPQKIISDPDCIGWLDEIDELVKEIKGDNR
ncbi:MAG: hypothetical protein K9K32_07460 [Halanaerobiales bacterium]|nr:hypothetical protein [Halanaerobiales bacterium]